MREAARRKRRKAASRGISLGAANLVNRALLDLRPLTGGLNSRDCNYRRGIWKKTEGKSPGTTFGVSRVCRDARRFKFQSVGPGPHFSGCRLASATPATRKKARFLSLDCAACVLIIKAARGQGGERPQWQNLPLQRLERARGLVGIAYMCAFSLEQFYSHVHH